MNIYPFPQLKPQSDDAEWLRRLKNITAALGRFVVGQISVTPGTVAANGSASVTVDENGIVAAMALTLNPPLGFPDGLDFWSRALDNQIVVTFRNRTGAPIVGAAGTWSYLGAVTT